MSPDIIDSEVHGDDNMHRADKSFAEALIAHLALSQEDVARIAEAMRAQRLSFEEAAKIFALPEQFRFTAYDSEHSIDDDRWISIGLIEKGVAIVVYVIRGPSDDEYRIISARYADPDERRAYADHLAGGAP